MSSDVSNAAHPNSTVVLSPKTAFYSHMKSTTEKHEKSHYRTKLCVVVAQACPRFALRASQDGPHAARTFKAFGLLNAGAHRGRCCATFANWNVSF